MKIFKKLLIWSLIAASIESVMLFTLNKIYAQPLNSYKEEKSQPQKSKKSYKDIKIPESAENIKVSYDGKYISYYENEVLKIVNSEDESSHDIDIPSNRLICYSKWLPDSNLLLLCEKDNANRVSFYSYDADKDNKKEIIDFYTKPLKIELSSKNDVIDNITLSTANHVMYIKVQHKNGKSDIYKTNIMNQIKKIKSSNDTIGNISMLHYETNLIYEDMEEEEIKNIAITATKKKGEEKEIVKISSLDINENDKKVLLSTDDEDKIYIGTMENKKVNKILIGDLKSSTEDWKALKLPEPADRKNIIITKEGNVYINDETKGLLKDVISNKEIKYKGSFIQIQDKYIFTLNNNKVIRTLI